MIPSRILQQDDNLKFRRFDDYNGLMDQGSGGLVNWRIAALGNSALVDWWFGVMTDWWIGEIAEWRRNSGMEE